ncbi:MAG: hypothetical protein J0I08_07620 [Rhizobiales bacterium]|nr:hypothetical protein [Hyphomicrobiales bacterium]
MKTSGVAIGSPVLSVAAAKEKKKRVSAQPKKSSIDKFLNSGRKDPTDKLLLVAAALWLEFWLVLHQVEGPQAIQYGERVNKSLTHMAVQTWMQKNSDTSTQARRYRVERTCPRARELLDAIIIENLTVEECARRRFGHSKNLDVEKLPKLDVERTRVEIKTFLMSFAGLVRLPGAN